MSQIKSSVHPCMRRHISIPRDSFSRTVVTKLTRLLWAKDVVLLQTSTYCSATQLTSSPPRLYRLTLSAAVSVSLCHSRLCAWSSNRCYCTEIRCASCKQHSRTVSTAYSGEGFSIVPHLAHRLESGELWSRNREKEWE